MNDEQVEAAFTATKGHFGRLDVVVNNTCYGLFGEAEGLPLDEAREQIEVLFWAPVKISLKVQNVSLTLQCSAMANIAPRPSSSSESAALPTIASTSSTSAPPGVTMQHPALRSTALESLVSISYGDSIHGLTYGSFGRFY